MFFPTTQENESTVHVHTCPPFWIFFPLNSSQCIGFPVLWSRSSLVICVMHSISSVCVSSEFINLGCIRAERLWHSNHSRIFNSRCSESFRQGGWSVPGEARTLVEPWVWVLLRFPLSLISIWMDCLNCPSRQMCSARTCHQRWKPRCLPLS